MEQFLDTRYRVRSFRANCYGLLPRVCLFETSLIFGHCADESAVEHGNFGGQKLLNSLGRTAIASIATRVEAIALGLEAIATRLEAFALIFLSHVDELVLK